MGSYLDLADNVASKVMDEVKKLLRKKIRTDDEAVSELKELLANVIAEEIKDFV